MEDLKAQVHKVVEGTVDFKGQELVETLIHYWLVITTIVAFVVGFVAKDVLVTCEVFGGMTALLALAVIPPWPYLNRHPVIWLPAQSSKKDQ